MDKIIESIPKNTREEIRISLTEYMGHKLVDVRAYFKPQGSANLVPTKKGVSFNVGLLPLVIRALQKAEAELE